MQAAKAGEGNVLPGQTPQVRLGGRLQQVTPATAPGASARYRLPYRAIALARCCILLLYWARELWAQDFEFISLN